MKFIALKTKDGELKGDIFFYCRILHVSRQGFYQYLANKDRPWKYQPLADAMMEILKEDDCNDIISEQEYRKLGCDERKRILYQGSVVKYA